FSERLRMECLADRGAKFTELLMGKRPPGTIVGADARLQDSQGRGELGLIAVAGQLIDMTATIAIVRVVLERILKPWIGRLPLLQLLQCDIQRELSRALQQIGKQFGQCAGCVEIAE